jgi:predicted ATPase/class 3 adenylate cyclase
MRRDLPSGTVTFLFTDIEGSTRLLHELGAERYAEALMEHRRLLRDAFARHGGVEVDTQGDAFFVAFATAAGAVAAAALAQAGLAAGPIRVRMGIHTGTPHLGPEGYVGADVHRGARIAAVGHGGQVLLSAATAGLVPGVPLVDLGPHRLKDLSAPERLHQLGDGTFPPLRSLHQTNLPVPLTPFVGREREVAEVAGLLTSDGVRLATLTGPGGTGKTRLSLAAAAAAADAFPDGVWWVPLAALRDPALVLPSIGQAVGSGSDVAERIGARRMLVVLDNLEQVVEAAGDIGRLLEACPGLAVLATSREALRIAGEHQYAVDPLDAAEAVKLFEVRAVAVRRDFVATPEVREICRRLDDLPLAIELAAARVKVLAASAILERLDRALPVLTGGARDAPERQRTLQGAIAWSHDLLDEQEQVLFRRLAVFRGGWTLEAAEEVTESDLDTLGSLVDKSLVRQRDDRFLMLETIREFALERLAGSGEDGVMRDRHAVWAAALVAEAEPHVRVDDPAWVARLERDHDNLRAALDRLEAAGRRDELLSLAAGLWRFWYLRSHLQEGRRRLEGALDGAEGSVSPLSAPSLRAKALLGISVLALNLGDVGAARARAEDALAILRDEGDDWGVAYATFMVANAAANEEGDLTEALELLRQAERRFEALGDHHYALIVSTNIPWIVGDLGDPEGEERLVRSYLQRARELGKPGIVAGALSSLAMLANDREEYDEAARGLRDALDVYLRLGQMREVGLDLGRLAWVLARAGDSEVAAVLLGGSDGLFGRLGVDRMWWDRERVEKTLTLLRDALREGPLQDALAQGRALSVEELTERVRHAVAEAEAE